MKEQEQLGWSQLKALLEACCAPSYAPDCLGGDGVFPLQDAAGCRKVKDLQWLVMDVVGENEALQQFFEGKSLA